MSNNDTPLPNNNTNNAKRKPFLSELVQYLPAKTFAGGSSIYKILTMPQDTVDDRFRLLCEILSYHQYETYKLIDDHSTTIISKNYLVELLNELSTFQINVIIRKSLLSRIASYLSREFVQFMDSQRDYTHLGLVLRWERSVMEIFSENKDLNGPYSLVWKSWKIYQGVGMKSMMSLSKNDIMDIIDAMKFKDKEKESFRSLMNDDILKQMAFSMTQRAFLVGAVKYFFYDYKGYVYYILSVFAGKDPNKIEAGLKIEDAYKTLVINAYEAYLDKNNLRLIEKAPEREAVRSTDERYENAIKILQQDNLRSDEVINKNETLVDISTPDSLVFKKWRGRPKQKQN